MNKLLIIFYYGCAMLLTIIVGCFGFIVPVGLPLIIIDNPYFGIPLTVVIVLVVFQIHKGSKL